MDSEVWELFHPSIAPNDGDLESYLLRIVEKCVPLFGASGASIFLEEHGEFRLKAQLGIDPPIPTNAKVKPGEGVAGACIQVREPMIVKDVQSDVVFSGKQLQRRADLGTAMIVPLTVPDGPVIGIMNFSRKSGEPDYCQPDLAQAASLAYQVALAISSGRLIAESKQAHAWLGGLMECVPAAVLALGADGSILDANLLAKELAEARPSWLNRKIPLGRTRIVDTQAGRVYRIDCLPAGDGRVIVAEDVTEEESVAENAEHMRRLAEIGQMAAAVAHEIRNPLTGIRASVQLLLDSPDKAEELASIIDDEVMRLSKLCQDFLELARPTVLTMEDALMSDVVSQVVRVEQAVAKQAGVQLDVQAEEPAYPITMDVNRVAQVLRNLIRNAIQACSEGGKCTVRVRSDWIEVEDDGVGMSEKTLQNLFIPFYTTKANGTGLGLTNSRKIIEAHGGKLTVASSPGAGARFKVDLRRPA